MRHNKYLRVQSGFLMSEKEEAVEMSIGLQFKVL